MGIETLTVGEALLIAGSGITTVFIMLACLSIMIVAISKIVAVLEKKPQVKAKPVEEVVTEQPKPEKVHTELTYGGEIMLIDVDEKTAACLMAIVSEETGISLNELVFTKIRAL